MQDVAQRWGQIVYRTLRAFVFGDEYAGGQRDQLSGLGWQLEIARLTGALVAFSAVLRALYTLSRGPLHRLSAEFRWGHAVVLGDAPLARKFAEAWRSRRRGAVTHHTDQLEFDRDGILSVPRDARVQTGLTKGSLRGSDRAVIAEMHEESAAETALAIARMKPRLPVFALVRDAWLANHVRHSVEPAEGEAWKGDLLITISEHAAAARAVFTRHPPHLLAVRAGQDRVHILIAGFGGLAEALIRDLLHTNLVGGQQRPMVTVLDHDATAKAQAFAARYPGVADYYDIAFLACDARTMTQDACSELTRRNGLARFTSVYITTGERGAPLSVALALQERARRDGLFSAPIFVAARDGAGLPTHPGGVNLAASALVPFASWADIIAASGLVDREPDKLAQQFHATYLDMDPSGEAGRPWAELKERFRNSNRRAVAHAPAKLASLGFDIEPLTRGDLSPSRRPTIAKGVAVFRTASELMAVARLEHSRWMADRLLDGWRYGPERDNDRRLHPNLVPFEELEAEIAAYDIRLSAQLATWVEKKPGGLVRLKGFQTPTPELEEDRAAVDAAGVSDAIGR
ncbi:RyR domain-containing protein [Maricaulaceae bacterium MS644]